MLLRCMMQSEDRVRRLESMRTLSKRYVFEWWQGRTAERWDAF